jgi:hypothetical protein
MLCLLALCALPSVAWALIHTISWHSKTSSATIYIGYKIRGGKPTKIITFEFNNVPAPCPPYVPVTFSDTFSGHIKVGPGPKWRFHATEVTNSGRTTYVVKGRFLTLHKARGTLRLTGTTAGCKDADTGLVPWTARRHG